jgi:5-methylcytosine-specific restriction endonuclease McrA
MPSKPNTVCAGSCGRLIWPNYSSASQPICRECRAQPEQPSLDCRRTRRSPSTHPVGCAETGCVRVARKRGWCSTHYNKATGHYFTAATKDPTRERARLRIKTYRRRDWARLTDITPEYELMLRAKAKRCSLCTVKLTDQPYLPNSKELDHIIPKGIGGTHTIGNVRILCRRCNIARPKDGSDYTGPVTLWAEVA